MHNGNSYLYTMSDKANDILFLPVKSNGEDDWVEKMVYIQCFYKFLRGDLKKLPSKKYITMLSIYIRFGDGKDFKKGKDAYRMLAKTDEVDINSSNKALRDLNLLTKGTMRESENEFCFELKMLRKYYVYLNSKESEGELESKFHFKMFLDDGHKE